MRYLTLLALILWSGVAAADDKYVGYYYPDPATAEDFTRQLAPVPPADRTSRVNFVTAITKAQLDAPANPRFVLFAKGEAAEHLVMVALDDEVFATIFRARAMLAQMTSNFRRTEFFQQAGLSTAGTFFDMLQMLRFETLIITDGAEWSHRVNMVRR
ncbi:MAG: hypothetical protein ACPGGK_04840 [Pikeienuella sp.]